MINDSKTLVYEYIKESTLKFIQNGTVLGNALDIADQFHLSRSVVSKYLNGMFYEGKLIKIATRPVIYFDRYCIENELGIKIKNKEFISITELHHELEKNQNDLFNHIIGKNGSLKENLMKIKSLNTIERTKFVLIVGESGTGKTFISNLIHRVSCKRNVSPLYLKCTEGNHDYQNILFDNQAGLYYLAAEGTLIIDNFNCIDEELQNEILFLLKNNYQKNKQINCIIFTIDDKKNVNNSLLNEVDELLELPRLSDRPIKEKEELILRRLKKNEHQYTKKVFLSKLALYSLSHFDSSMNIIALNQIIDRAIINANSEQMNQKEINIYQYHLLTDSGGKINSLKNIESTKIDEQKEMLDVLDIHEIIMYDKLISICEEIKGHFDYTMQYHEGTEQFIRFVDEKINQYSDYIVFEKSTNNTQIQIIENVIKSIFEVIENKYRTVINFNLTEILARFIYENMYEDTNIKNWENQQSEFMKNIEIFIKENYPLENELIHEISLRIQGVLEIKLDIISRLYLLLNLNDIVASLEQLSKFGIIIAHGYSAATSIAESVNRLTGKHVFKGIDMPLDIETSEIISKVRNYILSSSITKEIILLVDMGSLEQIGQEVSNYASANVGIINNISTKIALSVGYGIINGNSIEEILEQAMKASKCTTHIIGNIAKKKAILFTFDSGLTATKNVMQIFKSSIPKKTDIQFIAIDYFELADSDKEKEIIEKYDVLFIVGTYSTQLKMAPYVALEEIISFENVGKLYSPLKKILTNEEIKQFSANLLRNFSLENIMRNLTILNPNTLMNYIDEALKKLQRGMGKKFSTKVMSGLYLHISCMVERLVTKQPQVTHENIELFTEIHKDFINLFEDSFQVLMKHYNIKIPLSEIAYLHDYIENGFIYNKTNNQEDIF